MGQNLLVPSDSTADLGQLPFLRKKKIKRSPLTIDLDLSRLIFRCISNYLDIILWSKIFEVFFSPLIFDFSCFILFNLWSKILLVNYLVVLS